MTTANPPMRRGFAIKPLHIAGLSIILLTIFYGAFGLKDAFRSYTTSIAEARESGRNVQLSGFLGNKGEYDAQNRWTFLLEDTDGDQVLVVYNGTRPSNFDHATSIVAIGRYDASQRIFAADELLVKCPSKYLEEKTQ